MEPTLHNGSSFALGNITSGNSYLTTTDNTLRVSPYQTQNTPSTGTVSFQNAINYPTPQTKQIMQNKVAVFKVTRDEDNKITNTEFIKELWIQTKNNQSVDFQVARDKDLAEYDANDLIIKVILAVTF